MEPFPGRIRSIVAGAFEQQQQSIPKMPTRQTWFGDQAFGESADALVTVAYKSHEDALNFLKKALDDDKGLAALHGPKSSGKSTVARRLASRLPRDAAMALVDGARVKPREFLAMALTQFGYDSGLHSHEELIKMIRMVAIKQTRSAQPLVLIVDNVDRMFPSSLRLLNMLADIMVDNRFAIRMILAGGPALRTLLGSDGMMKLAKRKVGDFELKPLALHEALLYLHARLQACGVANADTVFPLDVCDRLYQQSGGWPGLMNKYAREAISRATAFPLRLSDTYSDAESETASQDLPVLGVEAATGPLPPRLIVTRDGRDLLDHRLSDKKTLIGRSDFADLSIDDDFVSKMHAVLILYSDALVLMDLNSANGTTVNSVTVRSTILQSNDIISLGQHRIKVLNAPAISDEMKKLLSAPDTIRMKNLVDLRAHREARLRSAPSRQQS